ISAPFYAPRQKSKWRSLVRRTRSKRRCPACRSARRCSRTESCPERFQLLRNESRLLNLIPVPRIDGLKPAAHIARKSFPEAHRRVGIALTPQDQRWRLYALQVREPIVGDARR